MEIGIAAIGCGADAVYLAGPSFGARQAAGNSVEDIREMCSYAHRFGARVFVTLNTILYDSELEDAFSLALQLQEAGADALIVQDFALPAFELERSGRLHIPLHASTQCSIRTVEDARRLDALGFSRIVLERELPLSEVGKICSAVSCEVEAFVHGALCVCYSGQCYLSEMLAGRSANRGECIQACRSRYDLVNCRGELVRWPSGVSGDSPRGGNRGRGGAAGRPVAEDRTLLSLRDLNLLDRLPEMAGAGVCSFKIEGRLKSISYVKNVVAAYSQALDALVASSPEKYRRASFGRSVCGFTPAPAKSFNRGFTSLFFDGRRGSWACLDAGKALGEAVGTVSSVSRSRDGFKVSLCPLPEEGRGKSPHRALPQFGNGDGFSFIGLDGKEHGFRADVCEGGSLFCSRVEGLSAGLKLYRNLDTAFEKELEKGAVRRIPAEISVTFNQAAPGRFEVKSSAVSEDGRTVEETETIETEPARNRERMLGLMEAQLGKSSGEFMFSLGSLEGGEVLPMLSSAQLNSIRRSLAEKLSALPVKSRKINHSRIMTELPEGLGFPKEVSYKADVANSLAEGLYRRLGAETVEPAYELEHQKGAELMRSRYCLLHELGLCRKTGAYASLAAANDIGDGLFLRNNGRLLRLEFDCSRCEMAVIAQTL